MNAVAKVNEAPINEIEIEQSLLGSALIDEVAFDEILGALSADDFYDPFHGRVFSAAAAMKAAGERVTPLTVRARLADDVAWKDLPQDYLKGLARAAPVSPPLADYTRILRDTAMRRRATDAANFACEALRDRGMSLAEALAPVLDVADRAAAREAQRSGLSGAGASAAAAIEDAEAFQAGRERPCISTGIAALDKMLGGLYGGDLVIVAGRPGMGKSSLGTHLARAAGEAGRLALFFSLEMTAKQLSIRLTTDIEYDMRGHEIPLSYARMSKGRAGDREIERAARAAVRLAELPIEIHDRAGMTMAEIASFARSRAAKQAAMGLIVIDHCQIIAVSDRYRGNRVQEITEITGLAKMLAKRLGWPVVLLCQLSRESEKRMDRRPQLSDCRDSGSIEQDADVVIGMYRPGYYAEHNRPADKNDPKYETWKEEYRDVANDLELIVLKQRMGETGAVPVYCDMGASVIRDKDHVQPITAGHEDHAAGLLV